MNDVAIKPYLRQENENQGLTKAGLVIADNCTHAQVLRCADNNGVKTYITGLNEAAADVQLLEGDAKDAKILDIRKTVVMAENHIAGNFAITEGDIYILTEKEVKDDKGVVSKVTTKEFNPNFWTKVTKFKSVIPDEFDHEGNRKPTFWDTVELKVGNVPIQLDQTKPLNVLLVKAIEANGFGDVIAPSLEVAENYPGVNTPKFYLDRLEQSATLQVEVKKLRNQAGAKLQLLFETDNDKMFYILKNLGAFSLGYRRSTPLNILYDDLDKHLDGLGAEKNKRIAVEKFLELCDSKKVSGEDLRIRAIAKDASALNVIVAKNDGSLYYNKTGTPIGKSFEDAVMWLKNPMYAAELLAVTAVVEKEWNTK